MQPPHSFLPDNPASAGNPPGAVDPKHVGTWAHPDGLLEVLQSTCRQLVKSLRAVQGAGVVVQFRGAPFPLVWTAPWVREVAERESGYRDGPCLRALHQQQAMTCDRTQLQARWPALAAATDDAGIQAVHAEPLPVDDHPVGVLALYSTTSTVINPLPVQLGPVRELLTAALTAYCAAHPHQDHAVRLQRELHNRQLLSQAITILMAGQQVSEELAREMLTARATDTKATAITTARAVIREHLAAGHPPPSAP